VKMSGNQLEEANGSAEEGIRVFVTKWRLSVGVLMGGQGKMRLTVEKWKQNQEGKKWAG